MANHFVGQKVRVNCPGSLMDGDETTVLALSQVSFDDGIYVGIQVECTIPTEVDDGLPAVFSPNELIPITDRPEVTMWEMCAWSPHGVSA